jgi:acetoin utilization deacetylase AcuC-like enzyme
MAKFRVLKETLVNSGAFRGTFVTPTHPFDDDGMTHVYAVHDQDYVDRFLANALTHDEKRRIGLAFNEHLVYRTLAEVGGTVATCDLAMETGLACNLAGGTHHAHRTFGRYVWCVRVTRLFCPGGRCPDCPCTQRVHCHQRPGGGGATGRPAPRPHVRPGV